MSRLEDRRGAKDGLGGMRGGGSQIVAALDIGASKVACFIMKADGVRRCDKTVRVAGVGYVQSRGVRGGAIVDVDSCAQAVAQAVERAEAMAGCVVQSVTVTSSVGQIASHRVAAEVSLGARPISDVDLSRAIAAGLAQVRFPNRRPIHLLPIGWNVDGQR
ncbi:MAG TPA: cell division protein FtsA, partial [Caulobacteraceae bacterium]|nr:cell division protein FtsA [Caulobacteraceae bacterium]